MLVFILPQEGHFLTACEYQKLYKQCPQKEGGVLRMRNFDNKKVGGVFQECLGLEGINILVSDKDQKCGCLGLKNANLKNQ